jgi:hypothetical protein
MPPRDELKKDKEILKQNPSVVIFWIMGIFLLFTGGLLLNANPPVISTGLPFFALGFAMTVYGLNVFSGIQMRNKIEDVLAKLEVMQKDLEEIKLGKIQQ